MRVNFERMAELQEEILWVCESAHVPVIWATQVLEGLAKRGHVSRAEISDAAMSQAAECVMLNKGPYIIEAVRMLDNILQRMQGHHRKKRGTDKRHPGNLTNRHVRIGGVALRPSHQEQYRRITDRGTQSKDHAETVGRIQAAPIETDDECDAKKRRRDSDHQLPAQFFAEKEQTGNGHHEYLESGKQGRQARTYDMNAPMPEEQVECERYSGQHQSDSNPGFHP